MPSLDECVADRLALEMFDRQAATIATAISETSAVTPELARLQGIALAGIFQILTSEAGRRAARARPMTRSPTDSGQPSRRSSTTSIAGLRPAQAERPEWQDPRERQAELAARRAQNLVSATSAHLRGGPGVRSGPEIGLPQRRGLVAGARIADLLRSSHQAGATASGVIQQRLVARVERRTTAARAPLLVCHEHLQRESDLLILRKTAQLAGECFHGLGALRPDDPSGDEGASGGRRDAGTSDDYFPSSVASCRGQRDAASSDIPRDVPAQAEDNSHRLMPEIGGRTEHARTAAVDHGYTLLLAVVGCHL